MLLVCAAVQIKSTAQVSSAASPASMVNCKVSVKVPTWVITHVCAPREKYGHRNIIICSKIPSPLLAVTNPRVCIENQSCLLRLLPQTTKDRDFWDAILSPLLLAPLIFTEHLLNIRYWCTRQKAPVKVLVVWKQIS